MASGVILIKMKRTPQDDRVTQCQCFRAWKKKTKYEQPRWSYARNVYGTMNRLLFIFLIFFLGRPLVRVGFAYFYFVFIKLILGNAPIVDVSLITFFSDSLAVNSGSSADSNAPLPAAPLHNVIPLDVVDQFHILNQETKLELFPRIRLLENCLIDDLPPKINLAEYEALVRQFLNDTLTIDHYWTVLNNELFDISVLELKSDLLENLVSLLMHEPTGRLTQILVDSPFSKRAIRPKALEFINDFICRLNLNEPSSAFDKRVVEAMLRYWIQDAQQNGNLSAVYREFLRYFLGQSQFVRLFGYAILGFALTEAITLFTLIMTFLSHSYSDRRKMFSASVKE